MADGDGHGRPLLHVGGIPVHVPPSGILGVALLAYLWAPVFAGESLGQQVLTALAFGGLLYLSIFVHELAHAMAARQFGYPVERIVLWILGGFTVYERRDASPRREATIAASGPLTTFAVAGVFWVLYQQVANQTASELCWALALANLLMGIYNMLPGTPLDGGAVLKAGVWAATGSERKGSVVAAWGGRVLAALVLALPFALAARSGGTPSMWNVVVAGMFSVLLWSSASAALRRSDVESRSSDLGAGDLARRAVPVAASTPLSEALRRASDAGAGAVVVVDHDGSPLSVVSHAAVAAMPVQRQPWVAVSAVSRRIEPETVLAKSLAGMDLLRHMSQHPASEYLVVDEAGLVYGVLAASDVEARLRGR